MTTTVWVLGSGGLLGSALCRHLRDLGGHMFAPVDRFCWNDGKKIDSQMAEAVESFAQRAALTGRWEVYWAAGVGTMRSVKDDLITETRVLRRLLCLLSQKHGLSPEAGAFALASSAGAIYAGSTDFVISETTEPSPNTSYAHAKLEQERLVREFAFSHGHSALLARITTLFGPGQSYGKGQGLIAHMARCVIRNQPIHMYVPFDTIRDYIATDDAAAIIVAALRAPWGGADVLTKIVASERPTTIAEIVSAYRKIARRGPLIVTSGGQAREGYSRRVLFRSAVLNGLMPAVKTNLLVGVAYVMSAERKAYARASAISIPGWRK